MQIKAAPKPVLAGFPAVTELLDGPFLWRDSSFARVASLNKLC